jgi:hypothetical protein
MDLPRKFIARFSRPILAALWVILILSQAPAPLWTGPAGLTAAGGGALLACLALDWLLTRRIRARRADLWFVLVVFLLSGYLLVRNSEGVSVYTWMYVYQVDDLKSFSGLLHFFKNLRIPIPPVLGVLEYISYAVTGSTQLVTRYAYQAALLANFLVVIGLARNKPARMYAAAALGLFLLLCVVTIHPGNPQTYDIFFPLLVLGYVVFLERALPGLAGSTPTRSGLAFLALAGLSLALADLTRPFFFAILLLLLALSLVRLWGAPRRALLAFLLPVLLLSGGWHAYQLGAFGQITWSNNGGFSLWRVWGNATQIPLPTPVLVAETHNQPLAAGRWANLNTPEHAQNSQILTGLVADLVLQHPLPAAGYALSRLATFFFVPSVNLYGFFKPAQEYLNLYKWLVVLLSLRLIYSLAVSLGRALGLGLRRGLALLSGPVPQLVLAAFLSAVTLALGDLGEESRFMLSLLPLFLAIAFIDLPASQSSL